MQTHLKIRNGCRKSITQWYAITWELLEEWRDEIPETIDDFSAAIESGNRDELWNIAESILEVDEIRDAAFLKLDHWEIEYATLKVQPLPLDQNPETEYEPEFTDIGFPFKASKKEWGTTYEVSEEELFAEEIKSKACILFYTYDNRCKYEYLIEASDPFDVSKFSYLIEKRQDGSFSGHMAYAGELVTDNWEGSGDECDGVHALYVNGQLVESV